MAEICKNFEAKNGQFQATNLSEIVAKLGTSNEKLQASLSRYVAENQYYGTDGILSVLNDCNPERLKTTLWISSLDNVKPIPPLSKNDHGSDWKNKVAHLFGVPTGAERVAMINKATGQ